MCQPEIEFFSMHFWSPKAKELKERPEGRILVIKALNKCWNLQKQEASHRLTIDLWLAKDNRFLNPKSSYGRILTAPPCRLISLLPIKSRHRLVPCSGRGFLWIISSSLAQIESFTCLFGFLCTQATSICLLFGCCLGHKFLTKKDKASTSLL